MTANTECWRLGSEPKILRQLSLVIVVTPLTGSRKLLTDTHNEGKELAVVIMVELKASIERSWSMAVCAYTRKYSI